MLWLEMKCQSQGKITVNFWNVISNLKLDLWNYVIGLLKAVTVQSW